MLHCGEPDKGAGTRGMDVSEAAPVRWVPDRTIKQPAWPVPKVVDALWRGARGLCPACGKIGRAHV